MGAGPVLLLGATGLIGSAVMARLLREGFAVRAVGRRMVRELPGVEWVRLDLREATRPEVWLPHLAGVSAVVNCAGVLQDTAGDSNAAVHSAAPAALYAACELAGVRRVVLLSAMGADRESLTDFSRTKREGEAALMARELDWVILRPSVVLGRPAYGGSALIRALAALPVTLVQPGAGLLQVVQLDEVTETVSWFLRPGAPAKVALELAGPQRLAFDEVVAAYRRWLGYPPARRLKAPAWLMGLGYRLGDLAGLLGWRAPVRTTARKELTRGAVGDPSAWTALTGISPRSLDAALATTPVTVQDRWFANLYLLKPLVFTVLSVFWIGTGIISLTIGWDIGVDYMLAGGAGPLSEPSVVAGALADIAIGLAIAYRPTTRLGLWAALAITAFYVVAGTSILPVLWADPLGPMWKVWPIVALNLVAFAILEDR